MKKTIVATIALAFASFAHASGAFVQSSQELPVCTPKNVCKVEVREGKTPGTFELAVTTQDGKPAVWDGNVMVLLKKGPGNKALLEATW